MLLGRWTRPPYDPNRSLDKQSEWRRKCVYNIIIDKVCYTIYIISII